jgi:hypothetical protein
MAEKAVKRPVKKVKKVRKVTKKKAPAKEVVKELPPDGMVEVPRALLHCLRRHLDVIASFKEWEEKKNPVGECVKKCSSVALRRLTAAVAYITGREKEPIFKAMRCNCYSPFHDQILGDGVIYRSKIRPFLKRGKNWKCAVCDRELDDKGNGKVPGISSWTNFGKDDYCIESRGRL